MQEEPYPGWGESSGRAKLNEGASMRNDQLQHSYFQKILSEAIRSYFVSCPGRTLSGSGRLCFTELHTCPPVTHRPPIRTEPVLYSLPPINLQVTLLGPFSDFFLNAKRKRKKEDNLLHLYGALH